MGALVLIAAAILILGAAAPRSYGFISHFRGKRDLEREKDIQITERLVGIPSRGLVVRSYTFDAPPDAVLAAMTKELTEDGWHIANRGPRSVLFLRAPHDQVGFERPLLGPCTVTFHRSPSWLADQVEGLQMRLGMR